MKSFKRRTRAIGASVGAASLVLSVCASATPDASASANIPRSHTLTLSFLQDPGQPPDPAVFYAGQGLLLQDNIYDGLVQYEPGTAKRVIEPDLATSWTVSKNDQTYTFQLRHGVEFHDGTPFNSSAIGPSFKRDSAVDGGPAYMSQAVASVDTPSPYTAVVHLAAPNGAFLDFLASPYGPRIYSPTGLAAHAGSDNDQTYLKTHDLGSGPYELTQSDVGVKYQLSAFPKYWGKKPYYTTVNLPVIDNFNTEESEFNGGQIAAMLHDLTNQAIKSYQKDSSVAVYSLPTLQSEVLYVNTKSGFLTTAAHRLTVLHAINVPQIVSDVYPGVGSVAAQVYPRNMVPSNMSVQHDVYDPDALKKLVASLPSSQRTLTIGYDTSSPSDQLIASFLVAQLDQTGLQASSVGYPTGTVYGWSPPGTVPSNAPGLLVEYIWPDAYDPYQSAHIFWGDKGGANFLQCKVPGLDSQLSQALSTDNVPLFGKVGNEEGASGCFYNLADRNDVFVAQPWLKGLPQGHVVAAPYSVLLDGLYPG